MSDYDKTINQLSAILMVRLAVNKTDVTYGRQPTYSKALLSAYGRVIDDLEKMAKDFDDEVEGVKIGG